MTVEYESSEELIEGDQIFESLNGDSLCKSGYPAHVDQSAVKQASNPNAMTADFIAVTRQKGVNRHGNKVQITSGNGGKGIMLQNFEQNPVWLFDHGMSLSLPIGTARDPDTGKLHIRKTAEQMTSRIFFSQTLAEAAQIFALVDEDILRAASIQFMPMKARFLRPKGGSRGRVESDDGLRDLQFLGLDFVESELMEISVVAIGADQSAIKKCVDRRSINDTKLRGPVFESLKQMAAANPESTTVPVQVEISVTQTPGLTAQQVETKALNDLVEREKAGGDTRVIVESRHYDVVQSLCESDYYIDDETDKKVFLHSRVVEHSDKQSAAAEEFDADRELMKVKNWAKGEKSRFDVRDPDTRDRYRQAFAYVSGNGQDEDNYQMLHHTIEDGELVVSVTGCTQASSSLLELPEDHRVAVSENIEKYTGEAVEVSETPAEKHEVTETEVDRIQTPQHPKIRVSKDQVTKLIEKQKVAAAQSARRRAIKSKIADAMKTKVTTATAELQKATQKLSESISEVSDKIEK